MAMKIPVVVFWITTPRRVKMEPAGPSEALVSFHNTIWCQPRRL